MPTGDVSVIEAIRVWLQEKDRLYSQEAKDVAGICAYGQAVEYAAMASAYAYAALNLDQIAKGAGP